MVEWFLMIYCRNDVIQKSFKKFCEIKPGGTTDNMANWVKFLHWN